MRAVDRVIGAVAALRGGGIKDVDIRERDDVRPEREEVFRYSGEWSIAKLPPVSHPECGRWFGRLYEEALNEVQRLGMHERWMANYVLSRAKASVNTRLRDLLQGGYNSSLSIGLIGSNIERTVANITARNPIASVRATDGDEELASIISAMCEAWTNEEYQQESLALAVKIQETYGTVIEKATLDQKTKKMVPVPLDITEFLPAPGKYRDIQKMPYCCHQYVQHIGVIESRFPHLKGRVGVFRGVDERFLMNREDVIITSNMQGLGKGSLGVTSDRSNKYIDSVYRYDDMGLVVEVWCRDNSVDDVGELIFPGGVRLVVLVYSGDTDKYIVAYDGPNPNINWALPKDAVKKTYLYDKFPFYASRSYVDTDMFWGFSQAETTGDIAQAIDELWRIIVKYLKLSLLPPIIIPRDTGIDKSQFAYIERLVLQPSSYQTSLGIRFLEMPTPPSWLFEALNYLMRFFDRTSQIEDVDRGDAPPGIIAASAIQMLQERAAALIRAKIRAVDSLVRNRGRCFISMIQNFHTEPEYVNVSGTAVQVVGLMFLDKEFCYVVESGSTVIKTEAEDRQLAVDLFQLGAIDQRALLEAVKFRGWRDVLERMAEAGPLEKAMEILIQAGIPVELAQQLYQMALEHQGGPGDSAVARGGVSNAMNSQPMPERPVGSNMRGKAPQRENGGAPARAGVPMTQQRG